MLRHRKLDVLTVILAVGALAVAGSAWLNRRSTKPRIPTATPVPDWPGLVDVALWERPPIGAKGVGIVLLFVEPGCKGCDSALRVIDSLRVATGTQFHVGYILFPRPAVRQGAISASIAAACAREQGRLRTYMDGFLRSVDPVAHAGRGPTGLDLNPEQLEECMKDSTARNLIERHVIAGRQLGIRKAPVALLNGFLLRPPITLRALDSAWKTITNH